MAWSRIIATDKEIIQEVRLKYWENKKKDKNKEKKSTSLTYFL